MVYPCSGYLVLTPAKRMNTKNMMLSEKSHKRPHNLWFHLYEMFRIVKSIGTVRLVVAYSCEDCRVMAKGVGFLLEC